MWAPTANTPGWWASSQSDDCPQIMCVHDPSVRALIEGWCQVSGRVTGAVMTLCHVSRTDVTPIRHTSQQYRTQYWTMNPGTSLNKRGSLLIDQIEEMIGGFINQIMSWIQIHQVATFANVSENSWKGIPWQFRRNIIDIHSSCRSKSSVFAWSFRIRIRNETY